MNNGAKSPFLSRGNGIFMTLWTMALSKVDPSWGFAIILLVLRTAHTGGAFESVQKTLFLFPNLP